MATKLAVEGDEDGEDVDVGKGFGSAERQGGQREAGPRGLDELPPSTYAEAAEN